MNNLPVIREEDEKNIDEVDEKLDEFVFINDFNYYGLFMKIGEKKSKKMVHYLMGKILRFGNDYNNPQRLMEMDRLKDMKDPYKRAFNKDYM